MSMDIDSMEYTVLLYITTRMRNGRARIDIEAMGRDLGVPEDTIYKILESLSKRRLITFRTSTATASPEEKIMDYINRIDSIIRGQHGDPLTEIVNRYKHIDRAFRELMRILGQNNASEDTVISIETKLRDIDDSNKALIPYRLRLQRIIMNTRSQDTSLDKYLAMFSAMSGRLTKLGGEILSRFYNTLLIHQEIVYFSYPLLYRIIQRFPVPEGVMPRKKYIHIVRLELIDKVISDYEKKSGLLKNIYDMGIIDKYLLLRQFIYIYTDISLVKSIGEIMRGIQGAIRKKVV